MNVVHKTLADLTLTPRNWVMITDAQPRIHVEYYSGYHDQNYSKYHHVLTLFPFQLDWIIIWCLIHNSFNLQALDQMSIGKRTLNYNLLSYFNDKIIWKLTKDLFPLFGDSFFFDLPNKCELWDNIKNSYSNQNR